MAETVKPVVQSKTIWFNVATIVAAVLAMPQLQELLGANADQILVSVAAVINILLRYLTVQPIKPIRLKE